MKFEVDGHVGEREVTEPPNDLTSHKPSIFFLQA